MILDWLLDPFQFAFMQRALLAIVLIGLLGGVMGAYVITRGMSFLGDALAHSVLPGVAFMFIRGGSTPGALLLGGMVAAVLSALGVGFLTRGRRLQEDTAIGIVFAGTLALGIGIISSTGNYAVDLTHILIGNVMAVGWNDLALMLVIGLAVIAIVLLLYKELLVVSFDPILAQTLRLPNEALRLLVLVLLAITIVIGVQAVGIALIAALLVTPAATARLLTMRLHHMMLLSSGISAFSGVLGLILAWHLEIAPSAAIVLLMTALFGLTFLLAPGRGYLWSLLGRSAQAA